MYFYAQVLSCWADFEKLLCNSKRVIQASTASSHRVGKCSIEPSKQSRIRRSSFWSHRRSTALWETALSSKERSRRVNCPMLVHYNTAVDTYQCCSILFLVLLLYCFGNAHYGYARVVRHWYWYYYIGVNITTWWRDSTRIFTFDAQYTTISLLRLRYLIKRARQWQAVTNAHYNLRRESGIAFSFGWIGNLADSLCAQLDCGGFNTSRARWSTPQVRNDSSKSELQVDSFIMGSWGKAFVREVG